MPNQGSGTDSSTHQLSPHEREALVSGHPLFCLLSANEVHELAQLLEEIRVEAGKSITQQHAIIDKLYLIASGTASVSKKVVTAGKKHAISVAVLNKGDAVGLSPVGIYSQSGMRTANVTAMTPMLLLAIDMDDFYHFLQRPDVNYPALRTAAEKILLMQFIQATHFFGHLKKEVIQSLAHNIKKISVNSGTYLFKEGDIADNAYFILSGNVAISTMINHIEHTLKTLKQSSMFGESALLEHGKRNASAIAKTDCELFVLDQSLLEHLHENTDVIYMFNQHIKQIRPVRNKHVPVSNLTDAEGNTITILTNKNNQEFQLSKIESLVWQETDGTNPLKNIFEKHKNEFKGLNILDLYAIMLKMKELGLVSFKQEEIKLLSHVKNILSKWRKRRFAKEKRKNKDEKDS